MALKDITITGSIGSVPSQSYGQRIYVPSTDQESIPLEQISGSDGGSIPDFKGKEYTKDLFVNISQSWSGSIDTKAGIVHFIHKSQEEFVNGEYSGSIIIASDGNLTDEDCEKFLQVNTKEVNYKPFFYYSSGSNAVPLGTFINANTSPNDGQIYLYWDYTAPYIPGGHS
jgi:hypothetical protein